jgi:flavin reductase (DIM6/NTAB) family NADH-FMN oxidoreductase RutF
MDETSKKTALRMIPYGIYVLTAKSDDGTIGTATVNWVTQTSFAPPLIAAAVKADSSAYAALKNSRRFVLNMLGKGQQGVAFAFFKPTQIDGDKISGEPVRTGETGAPILTNAHASVNARSPRSSARRPSHRDQRVIGAHVAKAPAGG